MSSDEEQKAKAILFGRDVGSIPCFRSSFLNGIGGGIGTGLIYFLLTSKVRQSCNTAVLSFAGITLSYWAYCRYSWSQRKFNMTMLQSAMKEQVAKEGTENQMIISSNETKS